MRWLTKFFAVIGVVVVLLVVAGVAIAVMTTERVPERTVMLIDFERDAVESAPDDALAGVMLADRIVVRDLIDALDAAALDDRVRGVVARVGGGHPMAMTQEFRQAVQRFRASGKPAIAFAETIGEVGPGNTGYYLATAFDEVYLQASGDIGLVGLVANAPFLRGLLEKLELEPRLDQRHEYKTAMNLFTHRGFDAPHREMVRTLLGSVFTDMAQDIAADRGMRPEAFARLIARGPFLGAEAVDAGLVDGLAYRDQVMARLEALAGDNLEALGPRAYLRMNGRPHARGTGVALIYGDGGVQRGRSGYDPIFGASSMGSDTVTAAFRDAIEDDDIRAIIFRVDSPGGSYVASDAIWRMTIKAREAGKPVVVTMGNVAASGGYFVAMATDRIIAQPGTLTGSIGVVGGKVLTEAAWEEHLGVQWDWEQTHPNAGMYGGLQDYTEQGWQRHQDWLDRVYDDFTAKVADGRGMSQAEAHEVAKGRVWTGSQALEAGLVDRLGGFGEAYAEVRELLEVEADAPLDIRVFPPPRPWYERLRRADDSPGLPLAVAMRALEEIQPLARSLRRAGVIGDRHALEMPAEIDIR